MAMELMKDQQEPAEVSRLRGVLERIAKYPVVRADELGYDGCRQVARAALKTPNVEISSGLQK